MSYRAAVYGRTAAALGVSPGPARIICDGCGVVRIIPEWPPQWHLQRKAPPRWQKASSEPRRDLCPNCKVPKQRRC